MSMPHRGCIARHLPKSRRGTLDCGNPLCDKASNLIKPVPPSQGNDNEVLLHEDLSLPTDLPQCLHKQHNEPV